MDPAVGDKLASLSSSMSNKEAEPKGNAHKQLTVSPCKTRNASSAENFVSTNEEASSTNHTAGCSPKLPRSAPDLTCESLTHAATSSRAQEWAVTDSAADANHRRSRKTMTKKTTSGHSSRPIDRLSPHHGRSQSVRVVKRPNRLQLPEFRSRVSSMPLESARCNPRLLGDEEFYRLRSFSITSKGVINRGDSLRSRKSPAKQSGGEVEAPDASKGASITNLQQASAANKDTSNNIKYRAVMLGGPDVGKTALTTQFLTSEYMNAYDASLDDEYGEKSVTVLLDGEESELIFIDHPSSEMSVENCITTYEPHAYVVVYSITDKASFQQAEDILSYLWKGNYMRSKAVILVGNKTDLVRSRVMATDGKSLATSHECKFIETSSGFNHNVDELLVGILSQIRLKVKRNTEENQKVCPQRERRRYKSARLVTHRAKEILDKLRKDTGSKSCENLHVL